MKEQNKLNVLRHSASHLLAAAVLEMFPEAKLAIGPAIEDGFYYDFELPRTLIPEDLPILEEKIRALIKQDLPFEKTEIESEKAKEFFQKAGQSYKVELIDDLEKTELVKKVSLYKTGPFVDLCAGPHVEKTGQIKSDAFKLLKIAGAYWRGDEKNKMLQRVYGTAFENKKELAGYLERVAEAEKRDHKKLGKELGLLMFHETAPGMPYWLPKGLILYKELENYWRVEHAKLGYKEIMSPLVNKSDLWKISGHWDHYKEDMFIADMGENEVYGIKPMNCPNAMLVFKNSQISYKDLPLRLSDTDRLHRYERSGTLNGLLRCRSFQQDDSHNFITEEMIGSEYEQIMEICKNFYGIFDLEYKFRLGTRPESFIGDETTWDKAEKTLKEILNKSGKEYTVAEKDGAFYGPKIDIIMKDCLGRDWQMGTMQLDFQLPLRFNLEYTDKDGQKKTPVVIHRVIYGSLERFVGILIEHYAGAFPVWLAPEQVWILPIGEKHLSYAKDLAEKLRAENIRVVLKDENETIGKKIREGEMQKIPYLLVAGDKEIENDSVAVRERSKGDLGTMKIDDFIEKVLKEIKEKK